MTWARVGRVAAVLACVLAEVGCGDTFRPVAIPITPVQPNPASLHYMLSLSSNGSHNAGASTRIDVSGDSSVATAQVGLGPVHAVVLPSQTAVYVANQMEDTISFYSPSSIAPVSTVSLPAGAAPVFVAATQGDTVYVANSGTGTVAAIPTASNVVTNFIPVGQNPIAIAETPDGKKLYVANQGSGTVTSINTLDKSPSQTITTGAAPVWAVARSDNARVYVLNSGSGTISTINTSTDALLGNVAVTAGANFVLYDKTRNRLYVTNPGTTVIQSFDVSVDPPATLPSVDLAAGANAPCPSRCSPASVAALPDGSRVYVASYVLSSPTCAAGQACTISAQVTVVNALTDRVSSVIPLGTINVDTSIDPLTGKPHDTGCNPGTSTHPARFRLFAAAASDSTRVYVSYCDAGVTAVIRTTPNTSPGSESAGDQLVTSLQAPVSTFNPAVAGGQPPPQNPVFVLAGP